jgi:hypothetical protein
VSSTLPTYLRLLDQPQVSFIDERRCLQHVARLLAPHMLVRHTMQRGIDKRYQLIERRLIAIAPVLQ